MHALPPCARSYPRELRANTDWRPIRTYLLARMEIHAKMPAAPPAIRI